MAVRSIRVGDAQQVIKQQQILGVCVGNPVAHSIAGGLPVKTLDAGGRAQQPRDGMEGDLAGVRLAEGGEHLHATATRHRRHLAHQTALADTRRPHHADHRAVAVDGTVQQALDGRHLPAPTDQSRLGTADSAMPFADGQQAMGAHRLVSTLNLDPWTSGLRVGL